MGAGKLISIDPSKFRISIAQDFGATHIINSDHKEEIKDHF